MLIAMHCCKKKETLSNTVATGFIYLMSGLGQCFLNFTEVNPRGKSLREEGKGSTASLKGIKGGALIY